MVKKLKIFILLLFSSLFISISVLAGSSFKEFGSSQRRNNVWRNTYSGHIDSEYTDTTKYKSVAFDLVFNNSKTLVTYTGEIPEKLAKDKAFGQFPYQTGRDGTWSTDIAKEGITQSDLEENYVDEDIRLFALTEYNELSLLGRLGYWLTNGISRLISRLMGFVVEIKNIDFSDIGNALKLDKLMELFRNIFLYSKDGRVSPYLVLCVCSFLFYMLSQLYQYYFKGRGKSVFQLFKDMLLPFIVGLSLIAFSLVGDIMVIPNTLSKAGQSVVESITETMNEASTGSESKLTMFRSEATSTDKISRSKIVSLNQRSILNKLLIDSQLTTQLNISGISELNASNLKDITIPEGAKVLNNLAYYFWYANGNTQANKADAGFTSFSYDNSKKIDKLNEFIRTVNQMYQTDTYKPLATKIITGLSSPQYGKGILSALLIAVITGLLIWCTLNIVKNLFFGKAQMYLCVLAFPIIGPLNLVSIKSKRGQHIRQYTAAGLGMMITGFIKVIIYTILFDLLLYMTVFIVEQDSVSNDELINKLICALLLFGVHKGLPILEKEISSIIKQVERKIDPSGTLSKLSTSAERRKELLKTNAEKKIDKTFSRTRTDEDGNIVQNGIGNRTANNLLKGVLGIKQSKLEYDKIASKESGGNRYGKAQQKIKDVINRLDEFKKKAKKLDNKLDTAVKEVISDDLLDGKEIQLDENNNIANSLTDVNQEAVENLSEEDKAKYDEAVQAEELVNEKEKDIAEINEQLTASGITAKELSDYDKHTDEKEEIDKQLTDEKYEISEQILDEYNKNLTARQDDTHREVIAEYNKTINDKTLSQEERDKAQKELDEYLRKVEEEAMDKEAYDAYYKDKTLSEEEYLAIMNEKREEINKAKEVKKEKEELIEKRDKLNTSIKAFELKNSKHHLLLKNRDEAKEDLAILKDSAYIKKQAFYDSQYDKYRKIAEEEFSSEIEQLNKEAKKIEKQFINSKKYAAKLSDKQFEKFKKQYDAVLQNELTSTKTEKKAITSTRLHNRLGRKVAKNVTAGIAKAGFNLTNKGIESNNNAVAAIGNAIATIGIDTGLYAAKRQVEIDKSSKATIDKNSREYQFKLENKKRTQELFSQANYTDKLQDTSTVDYKEAKLNPYIGSALPFNKETNDVEQLPQSKEYKTKEYKTTVEDEYDKHKAEKNDENTTDENKLIENKEEVKFLDGCHHVSVTLPTTNNIIISYALQGVTSSGALTVDTSKINISTPGKYSAIIQSSDGLSETILVNIVDSNISGQTIEQPTEQITEQLNVENKEVDNNINEVDNAINKEVENSDVENNAEPVIIVEQTISAEDNKSKVEPISTIYTKKGTKLTNTSDKKTDDSKVLDNKTTNTSDNKEVLNDTKNDVENKDNKEKVVENVIENKEERPKTKKELKAEKKAIAKQKKEEAKAKRKGLFNPVQTITPLVSNIPDNVLENTLESTSDISENKQDKTYQTSKVEDFNKKKQENKPLEQTDVQSKQENKIENNAENKAENTINTQEVKTEVKSNVQTEVKSESSTIKQTVKPENKTSDDKSSTINKLEANNSENIQSSKQETNKFEVNKSEVNKSDTIKIENIKSDSIKSENIKSKDIKSENVKSENIKSENSKSVKAENTINVMPTVEMPNVKSTLGAAAATMASAASATILSKKNADDVLEKQATSDIEKVDKLKLDTQNITSEKFDDKFENNSEDKFKENKEVNTARQLIQQQNIGGEKINTTEKLKLNTEHLNKSVNNTSVDNKPTISEKSETKQTINEKSTINDNSTIDEKPIVDNKVTAENNLVNNKSTDNKSTVKQNTNSQSDVVQTKNESSKVDVEPKVVKTEATKKEVVEEKVKDSLNNTVQKQDRQTEINQSTVEQQKDIKVEPIITTVKKPAVTISQEDSNKSKTTEVKSDIKTTVQPKLVLNNAEVLKNNTIDTPISNFEKVEDVKANDIKEEVKNENIRQNDNIRQPIKQPNYSQPITSQPIKSEANKQDINKQSTIKPENNIENKNSNSSTVNSSTIEPKVEAVNHESTKTEPSKVESINTDTIKMKENKVEPIRVEQNINKSEKIESKKVETNTVDTAKVESVKTDTVKSEPIVVEKVVETVPEIKQTIKQEPIVQTVKSKEVPKQEEVSKPIVEQKIESAKQEPINVEKQPIKTEAKEINIEQHQAQKVEQKVEAVPVKEASFKDEVIKEEIKVQQPRQETKVEQRKVEVEQPQVQKVEKSVIENKQVESKTVKSSISNSQQPKQTIVEDKVEDKFDTKSVEYQKVESDTIESNKFSSNISAAIANEQRIITEKPVIDNNINEPIIDNTVVKETTTRDIEEKVIRERAIEEKVIDDIEDVVEEVESDERFDEIEELAKKFGL